MLVVSSLTRKQTRTPITFYWKSARSKPSSLDNFGILSLPCLQTNPPHLARGYRDGPCPGHISNQKTGSRLGIWNFCSTEDTICIQLYFINISSNCHTGRLLIHKELGDSDRVGFKIQTGNPVAFS